MPKKRWLRDETRETEDTFQECLLSMNKVDLTFGGGRCSFTGQRLCLLEVYKVIATLVSRYDTKLVLTEKDWRTPNSFFVRQTGYENYSPELKCCDLRQDRSTKGI
ncbi:Cytochrome P450 E-class group I [Penicillium expansum]|nr:Cytochrome P450 E-class group I [Penicillium expansum]